MENTMDLTQFGNLPRQVRQRLATEEAPQPSEPAANTATAETPTNETEQPQSPENGQSSQPDDTNPAFSPETPPTQTAEKPAEPQDNDEVKAWKGRLTKEQQARKDTEARLLAEAEARQKAEAAAREAQEKLMAFEQQSKAREQNEPPQAPPTQANPEGNTNTVFSAQELDEMELVLGEVGKKATDYIRQQQNQPQASPPSHTVDVEKLIDQRFDQERQRNEEQAKTEAFSKAISEHAPKLQGLINTPAFIEYVNSKVIDFAGNTAATFLNYVGANKRADLAPKIAEIIAEFEQSRQPPAQTITAPPSNKGSAVNVQNTGKKPKPTPEILAQMKRLMRLGEVEKLRELQDKYDLTT